MWGLKRPLQGGGNSSGSTEQKGYKAFCSEPRTSGTAH